MAASVIAGVPFRPVPSGLRNKMISTQLQADGVEVQDWGAAVARLFGRKTINQLIDDSHIDDKGSHYGLNWSNIDDKAKNIYLYEFSRTATQAMLNERLGLPLMFFCTEVVISNTHQWKIMWNEIVQVPWVEVAPTGIPRTTTYKTKTEEGSTRRYKHFFTMPNDLLVDERYGEDDLNHALESVIETCLFTLMTETSYGLAMCPMMREYINRHADEENANNYTFLQYYRRNAAHFCEANINPNAMASAVSQMAQEGTPRNTLIFPQGCEWYLADVMDDIRAFDAKWADMTKGTEFLAQAVKTVKIEVTAAFTTASGPITCIANPTFKRERSEPEHLALQTLRRKFTMASEYTFPDIDPMELGSKMSADRNIIQIHQLDQNNGRWMKLDLAEGIRKSNHGFWCLEPTSATPSPEASDYLAALDKEVEFHKKNLEAMEDCNTPTDDAMDKIDGASSTAGMQGYRDFDPRACITDRGSPGVPRVQEVQQIGEIEEPFHRTQRFFDLARNLAAEPDPNRLAATLARIFGISTLDAQYYIATATRQPPPGAAAGAPAPPISVAEANEVPRRRGDDFYNDMATFYRSMFDPPDATQQAGASRGRSQPPHAAGGPRLPAPGPLHTSVLDSVLLKAPNPAFARLQSHAPLFERLEQKQKTATHKLVEALEHLMNTADTDIALAENLVTRALAKLQDAGIHSAEAGDLPKLTTEMIRSIKSIPSPADHVPQHAPRGSAEWSHSLAHQARLDAGGVEDAMDLDAGADLGAPWPDYRDGANARVDFAAAMPIANTRWRVLEQLVPTMLPLELTIMFLFFRAVASPNELARFAANGITFFSYRATRFFETVYTGSLLLMRRGGETVKTIMTPLRASMSSRGVVGETDFVFEIQHGMMWADRDGIDEMPHFFPHRVIHGWNCSWQSSIKDLQDALQGNAMRTNFRDVTLIVGPHTETHYQYPIHGLAYFDIDDEESSLRMPSMNHRATGYDTLQKLIGLSFLTGANSRLNMSVDVDYSTGAEIHYCPLVEQIAPQHYDVHTRKWAVINGGAGTGPRRHPAMSNPHWLGEILNGKKIMFPTPVHSDS